MQSDVTGLKCFKIWEDGLNPSDQSWGIDRMIANKDKDTFQIPSCISAGQYLLRHEMIGTSTTLGIVGAHAHLSAALHGASSYPGAQFYVS